MCGIFGWIPSKPYRGSDMSAVARSLFDSLKERGPDDRGYALFAQQGTCIANERHADIRCGAVLLGQTRLSILDLSAAGHQPMFSRDGRYCIVYNGEIYNYKELRTELEDEGIVFNTKTDTEVLLYAYATWKRDCLKKLTGMYAFAIYDTLAGKLFCARDCFGIKPFFWSYGDNGFCFASEIPALLQVPGVGKRVHALSVCNFLTAANVERNEQTMVEGVFRLLPARFMEVDVNRLAREESMPPLREAVRFRHYWKIPLTDAGPVSEESAAEHLREMFLDSVRLHLRSDVPLGVALSGGIDSTAVACAIRYLEPEAEIHAFGYVADEPSISEEKWIRLAAAGCGAVCHTAMPGAADLLRDLDRLVLRQGEPFATTSIYASYATMRLASENGIKVILEGQGADELFAGYTPYLGSRAISIFEQEGIESTVRFLEAGAQWPGREKQISGILQSFGIGIQQKKKAFRAEDMLNIKAFFERGTPPVRHTSVHLYKSRDRLRAQLANQLTFESVPGLMRHGDRNAMTFSLENRVPFLTPRMAEFAMTLPEEFLLSRDGCTKYILRKALRGIVPDATLDRRDKIGFEAPGLPWLKILLPWFIASLMETRSVFLSSDRLLSVWKDIIRGAVEFDWFYWRVLSYCRWKDMLGLEE